MFEMFMVIQSPVEGGGDDGTDGGEEVLGFAHAVRLGVVV